jgi:glycerate 2-kinase
MKVICAPDSFKESLSAVDAARAMAKGVHSILDEADIDHCPIGDGGEGTLESLLESVEGRRIVARAADVFGESIETDFGLINDGRVAFVESAAVIGLALKSSGDRDVMRSSSTGVGELILGAANEKPATIVVGVGGSATNDGGCGMAQALGVRFYDFSSKLIERPITGGTLASIARIDASHRIVRLHGISIFVACDVTNPLTGSQGAAAIYAAQKGASIGQLTELDLGLAHLADLIRRDLNIEVENIAGGGAAGGLGAGLVAFTGARVVSGIDTILDAVHFDERIKGADLCLTGEGRLDAQSLAGKACIGVARVANRHGIPVVALVGSATPGTDQIRDTGLAEIVVIGEGLGKDHSIRHAASLLSAATARIAGKYARNVSTLY